MNTVANTLNGQQGQKKVYQLRKYTFIVKDEKFKPSDKYNSEKNKGKLFVNLKSNDERKEFFNELKELGIRGYEVLYEYFVFANQQDKPENTFNSLVAYIRNVCNEHEETKQLINPFKVVIERNNFKVIVTSYLLAKYLNEDKMFRLYKSKTDQLQTKTQSEWVKPKTWRKEN